MKTRVIFAIQNHTKMLRFSNKIKYGLQFLLFLDVDTEEYTDIQRAALSCELPHKFLEGIAVSLKKHGILEVKRGAGGGYRLSREAEAVTLGQVVQADRKSTRLNSSHVRISYAVFCLKKKKTKK